MRIKRSYSTSRAAWNDISERFNVKPSQVIAKHSSKAWMWVPKKGSGLTLLKPGENKAGKIIKNKKKSKSKSKKQSSRKLTKNIDLCENIKSALNDDSVKEIVIRK